MMGPINNLSTILFAELVVLTLLIIGLRPSKTAIYDGIQCWFGRPTEETKAKNSKFPLF
uniref:Uncharacterized protein n=1 Tax=Rhizophora mucronata TaxID=61149 RepID=A0A2P2QQ71_RHIMU